MPTPTGLSYDSMSPAGMARMAELHTLIGAVYRDEGMADLEKIAAWQAAWFRLRIVKEKPNG